VSDDQEKSLGDAATFAGAVKHRSTAEISIGNERTLGDGLAGQDTVIDDIEVVDIESRYKIEGTLGQGGMGAVLLATDTRLDRKVAIKRILGEAAGNRMAVQRFLTEAKSIAALNHPNIVQIYDYGQAKDGPFLIMEYVDGGSLLDKCKAGPIPLDESIDLACSLCDGLAKAHDLGITHRDIKPANVLLTNDGIPKLTDFGLAKAQSGDNGHTMTGAVLGTPDFMPPEQRQDASLVDHRSDIWSLAATVYQMVTGRSPKIIRFDLLPAELTKALGKALEDDKAARFQSAQEFYEALQAASGGGLKAAVPPQLSGVLQEGQCKSCGTVTSDLSKKFCRNPQCGVSLRQACLKCDAQIPVWDGVCGECGGNQSQLLPSVRAQFEEKRSSAIRLLAALAFDEAIGVAGELSRASHPELVEFADWGRSFLKTATSERDGQLAAAAMQCAEAEAHRSAWDYPAAVQAIEKIPLRLRDSQATGVLQDCLSRQEESARLIGEIANRVKSKHIDGLLPLVQRAVELRGDRADLAKIYGQLIARRDGRRLRAQAVLNTGDARSAVEVFDGISVEDFTPADHELIALIRHLTILEDRIAAMVKDAKADAKVTPEEAVQILQAAEEYLGLNPRNQKVALLADQCRKIRDAFLREQQEREQQEREQREREQREREQRERVNSGATPKADSLPQWSEGQCTSCKVINTDLSRKFCRNCASPLRRQCLACQAQIPAWEGICGECGGNQKTLAKSQAKFGDGKKLSGRDRVRALVYGRPGKERVKCPTCGVECYADRLIQHFDRQHGGH
jgi:hypothetical protein